MIPIRTKKVFLDNAATSYPKPTTVLKAINHYLSEVGASPGRGGYNLSLNAGRIVFETREAVRALFNAPAAEQVIFTLNVTHALNMALQGLLKPGDHVITTSMEHNSVIRPLRALEKKRSLKITIVPCHRDGSLDPKLIATALRPSTRLIIFTHASNVSGTLMPVAAIAAIARKAGVLIAVDSAQTAGVVPLDFQGQQLDVLAFTGHKSLYGPPGTGGLVISSRVAEQMEPLLYGGTGSKSELQYQPDFLPDKFEAGTINT
ncbi:MAG TPA: aminotransferase class V-fold PLP-dependent enzyme, partial [bacterium]|nr:aminotransferase class V-fold PLP-dependent enzyme [bacterium]